MQTVPFTMTRNVVCPQGFGEYQSHSWESKSNLSQHPFEQLTLELSTCLMACGTGLSLGDERFTSYADK